MKLDLDNKQKLIRGGASVLVAAGLLAGLYLAKGYSYNLFHSLAEVFSCTIALTVFVIAWNSRRIVQNNYLLVVGVAYLCLGIVVVLHTLAYKDMGVFATDSADLATQLWVISRYLEASGFLLAPLLLGRRLNPTLLLGGYLGATTAFLLTVFAWPIFPQAFVDGEGLTTFKVVSEYLISASLVVSLWLLYRRRHEFDRLVYRYLAGAIAVSVCSELAFTLYTDVFGLSNLVGHYLQIVAFYLIYKALAEVALARPYTLLFRELKQSEKALRHSESQYRSIADMLQDALLSIPEHIPGLAFGHLYRSATSAARVGGDFYDLFELNDSSVGIIMGDVSGKGIEAAALASVVKDTIRAYAYEGGSPAGIVEKTNEVVVRSTASAAFVTAFFGILERHTGRLRYCSAGHPPALLRRRTGEIEALAVHSPVMGVFEDIGAHEHEVVLRTGDALLLYTDGVIEARNSKGLFGEERLRSLLQEEPSDDPENLPRRIRDALLDYTAGGLSDDVALLVLSRMNAATTPTSPNAASIE